MTLEEADNKAEELFGEDAFCAIDYADRCEVFYKTTGSITHDVVLLGRGGDWDEAFEQAIPFFAKFYDKDSGATA